MGRKSWDKELEAKALWDLSVPVLKRALLSESIPFFQKVSIAQFLVGKMIPAELKGEGFASNSVVVLINKSDNERIKYIPQKFFELLKYCCDKR